MIRPATHSDIETVTAMVMQFFAHGELDGTGLTPDLDTVHFLISDMIDMENTVILVAEEDGQIVGAIAGRVDRWLFNYDNIILSEIGWFVPKENRAKYPRVAFQLLKDFKTWGKEMGATTLVIVSTTREESPRVIEFYHKMGLKHIDNNFIGIL